MISAVINLSCSRVNVGVSCTVFELAVCQMLAENREFFHNQPVFKNPVGGDFVGISQRF